MSHAARRVARAAQFLTATALALAAAVALAQQPPPAAPATDCADCPELAQVPPGQFLLGTPTGAAEVDAAGGESPPITVTIARPFMIAKREVTVGEFRRFVEDTGYAVVEECRVWLGGQWVQARGRSWRDPGYGQPPRDDQPVTCVNWDDAQAYADWVALRSGLRYRLPSEAEWEYVARGGSSWPRYWSAVDSAEQQLVSRACEFANVYDAAGAAATPLPWPSARCSDGEPFVAAVGRYKPNAFGVHDLIGNVREWVADCWTTSHHGRPADGRAWTWTGGCEARGVRGGSWAARPAEARAAFRSGAPRGLRQADLGFRLARDL